MSDVVEVARRPRRSSAEVRARLLAAGRDLFAEQGYEATTQRQIAAAAGASTAALFHHFGSKAQLLLEAVIEPFGSFVAGLAQDFEAARTAGRPAGRWFAADLLEHLQVHRGSLRALLTALQSADGDVLMAELGTRLGPLFGEIRAHANGEGRTSAEDTDLALRLVVGMITTIVVLDDWFLPPPGKRDQARLAEVLGNMATRGDSRGAEVHPTPPAPSAPAGGRERSSTPIAGRRTSDEVRHALLAAASRLFVQHGFAATSYLDIASTASTSESALFRHFGSKSNLLIEAVLEPFAAALDEVSRQWATVAPDIRRARQPEFVADLYLTLVTNRQLLRILMGVANDPAHSDLNAAVSARFARTFEELLAQHEAHSDADHAYEPELRLRAALAMIVGAAVLDDWFLAGADGVEPARAISAISALISRGRRPPDFAPSLEFRP